MSVREQEPVAIVGMGCLFPQSPDLQSYWRNIVSGRDCLTDVPRGHSWSPEDYYDPDPATPDKTWCTRGGFLDKVSFDPLQFGIPPAMLESIDTTQLLSLIVAREALRDAGLDPDGPGWDRERVSVILGITGTQEMAITAGARLQGPIWRKSLLRCGVDPALADVIVKDIANHFPTWTEQTFPGLLGNVVSGRIANRLDLGGTNAVVDAACASSLAALQYAVADLLAGRSDLVLTGGADTLNDIFMFECFTRTPAFTKRGDARPFDASADGILIGEGIAICAFKRLTDAQRDGDRVYAVLRGLGSSSDGRFKSIYAPNPTGQAKALRRTYAMAGFGPETVELVEAHGTGTKAGDAAEIEALTRVYRESGREGRWATLGSVKSQIGHTKSTAGAAGLVKAALALYQRVLPPTAKVELPNPKMAFDKTPFFLCPRARPWLRTQDHPRRAAVSAFGFGGSNFHAVLEEYGDPRTATALSPAETELFLVSGDSADEVSRKLAALGGPTVTHASRASLREFRPQSPHVVALLASSLEELSVRVQTALRRLQGAAAQPRDEVWVGGGEPAPVAWLFPGQGSQYVEMGRTLALRHPVVREVLCSADESFRSAGLPVLSSRTSPPPAWSSAETQAQEEALRATEWAQPAIGALSKAMADLLLQFGLKPSVVAGHSYGELVALHVAGVLDEESLWTASRERGRLMGQGGDRGGMAAVDAEPARAQAVADKYGLVLANLNHPAQAVLSGPKEQIRRALAELGPQGRELPVSAAFHSPLVADAQQPFRQVLADLPLRSPSLPVLGCATAAPYPAEPQAIADQLAEQLVRPVDWVATVNALWERGVRTFVEVGPKGVLSGLVEKCLAGRRASVVALDRLKDKEDGDTQLKRALAVLATLGHPVDPAPLLAQREPPAPRLPAGPASVWLAGANHRNPETLEPPMPSLPKPPADLGWAAVPSSGKPMEKPVHLDVADPSPAPVSLPAASPAVSQAQPASSDLLALLDSTRATLAAFQDAQARTAEVHGKFLDAVARANDNFARLFEAQTRLVEQVATGGVAVQAPRAPVALPPAPAPVVAPVAPSRPAPLDLGPVALPSHERPAVATDLPPIFDARAAVEAKAAPTQRPSAPAAPRSSGALREAVLAAVAAKTGYPRDSLELSMDLESDLGIDSIKRVEILSAVRETVPGLPELADEKLSALRTLADVVKTLEGPDAPQVPVVRGPGRGALVDAMLTAVAAKTGYPRESLELSMDLESDLGVDSIKRVEILSAVRESVPGLPEVADEKLSSLRTLEDVVKILVDGAGVPELLRPKAPPSRDRLVGTLLEAVAVKTGFPRESLDLSMDLESDLGIDSIKRVEILSAVREAMPELPEVADDVLSGLRKLGDVVDHLGGLALGLGFALIGSQSRGAGAPALLVPPEPPAPPVSPAAGLPPVQSASDLLATAPSVPVSLRRRSVALIEAPLRQEWAARPRRWVITADPGGVLAAALAQSLQKRGIEAVVLDPDWNTDAIEVPVCGAVVHLAAVGAKGDDAHKRVRGAFLLARAVGPQIQLFVTVSQRGGRFGRDTAVGDPLTGGLAGLAKTLALEWPETRALALDIGPVTRLETDVEAMVDEMLGDRGVIEVGSSAQGAITLTTTPELPEPGELPLEKGDLVVVTGGGRGVTAACMVALAQQVPVSLLLMGRSTLEDEPDWASGVPDSELVGQRLRVPGPRPTPRQAEAEAASLRATREVHATLRKLADLGCEVTYASLDGRDAACVQRAVEGAVSRHGPVRMVVHGAGVLADRRVVDKTPEQFDRVLGTKVDGWRALMSAVDVQQLRLAVAFTSIAGRQGNVGQCDYAMANEVLTHELLALQDGAPHVRVRAIDWGPWDGGMVTASLKAHFLSQGHVVIPLELGARAFVEELSRDGDEVVIEGPRPGTGQMVRHLSGQAPWLRDHAIDERPVLPAAVVVEWAAELAADVAPGRQIAAVRDLRVLKGVVLEGGEHELTLSWQPAPSGRPLSLQLELRGEHPHYRAVVDLANGEGLPPLQSPFLTPQETLAAEPFEGAIYDRLFHGPMYRVIEQVVGLSEQGAVAWIRRSSPSLQAGLGGAALGGPAARWQTDPLAIDAALQLMLLWVRERRGAGALPTALGAVRWRENGAQRLRVDLQVEGTARAGRFSASFFDAEGELVGVLEGGEYTAAPGLLRTLASS
jgi:acyl transferase domain-containing protein/NAD(P)-dependent dehydrogenase (short-subunit alcohol dehydrogenase family)